MKDDTIAQPVSTVTKHVKLYSDNPIHDCIDRLIDTCNCLDESGKDSYDFLQQIRDTAEELFEIAERKILLLSAERLAAKSDENEDPEQQEQKVIDFYKRGGAKSGESIES
jgi:spore cortex formation protein SpoVR/YcgB (stage V sporulation)